MAEGRPVGLRFLNRVVNPLVAGVLRSPAHRLASRSLLVLELTGAHSGRSLALPLAYRQTGPEELRVHVGGWKHKLWWRNLREPSQVTIWLRGNRVRAIGEARSEQGAVDVVLELTPA